MSRYKAFFIVGPTAVGKSAVAQHIAERDDLDIVSADSMLVYKGMDIGTAKPSVAERSRVRYWGIDLVAPAECFSVGAFHAMADKAFEQIATRGRKAVVVGGTGLYVKSLTDGLVALPPSDPEVRSRWEIVLAAEGVDALAEKLRKLDPARHESLSDKRNPRRLLRALELAEAGVAQPAATWRQAAASTPLTGLIMPGAALHARIQARVLHMYESGLLKETERLLAEGLRPDSTACQAIGYAEAIACLNGRCSREEAMARTMSRTRQLAKRQLTWFRRQANVAWIEIDERMTVAGVAELVREQWRRSVPVEIAEPA